VSWVVIIDARVQGVEVRPIKLAWHFLIHILIGTAIFVGIGIAYFALHLFVEWLEEHKISPPVIVVLRMLEYLVFGVDALSYSWFVIILGLKFGKEIYKELRND